MAYDIQDLSHDLTDEQRDLVRRILDFEIDPGDHAFSYTQRLARENGWSEGYAYRVTNEYLRFIALAVVAGHPVTPSQAVDEAWHLHLSYTRSYWDRMCGEVIGRPIHHTPTQGGSAQAEHYWDQYELTRKSYNRVFLESPPQDLWPPPAKRFAIRSHAEENGKERRRKNVEFGLLAFISHAVLLAIMLVSTLLAMVFCAPATQNAISITLFAYLVIHLLIVFNKLGWLPELTLTSAGRGGRGCGTLGCSGGCGGGGCGGGCGGC